MPTTENEPSSDPATPPTLETERLVLRPLTPRDAAVIAELAGDRRVAAMTLRVPHPYEEDLARAFIAKLREGFAAGEALTFGIVRRADRAFVGIAGLEIQREHERAEIGYWIGVPYWGQSFATEATRAVVDHGFGTLGLSRIYAHVYRDNPASRRVLEKIGLGYEGCQPGHIVRLGARKDLEAFGLLRSAWRRRPGDH